jgi:hypothetical protein
LSRADGIVGCSFPGADEATRGISAVSERAAEVEGKAGFEEGIPTTEEWALRRNKYETRIPQSRKAK